jgi:hypothetical protein
MLKSEKSIRDGTGTKNMGENHPGHSAKGLYNTDSRLFSRKIFNRESPFRRVKTSGESVGQEYFQDFTKNEVQHLQKVPQQ